MKTFTFGRRFRLSLSLAGWIGLAAGGAAPLPQAGRQAVSRADFAAAYIRFESAALAPGLASAETARAGREFDALTLELPAKGYGEALGRLNALTASLDRRLGGDADYAALASIRIRLEPAVWTLGGPPPRIRFESLSPASAGRRRFPAVVRFVPPVKSAPLDVPAQVDPDAASGPGQAVTLEGKERAFKPGRYRVGWALGSGAFLEGAAFTVVRRSLDEQRAANDKELAAIKAETPALAQALEAVKARNALLTDAPPAGSVTPYVLDLAGLADEVLADISALRGGADPFKWRTGDHWRTFAAGERAAPARVYLSPTAERRKPLPVVVALHGAAGDENVFMDGFGGTLKRLAEEKGFLLVTPASASFGPAAEAGPAFDRFLDALSIDYDLDKAKVFLLGHSLGGMTASALAAARPRAIASTACLCGFLAPGAEAKAFPRTLVVAAELDPIVRPERLAAESEKARAAGLPVEYRLVPGYGHTLVVPKVLPETVAWLLK